MPKNVRYYITETDDRPIVRSVPVRVRDEAESGARPEEQHVAPATVAPPQSTRLRLKSRLLPLLHHSDRA